MNYLIHFVTLNAVWICYQTLKENTFSEQVLLQKIGYADTDFFLQHLNYKFSQCSAQLIWLLNTLKYKGNPRALLRILKDILYCSLIIYLLWCLKSVNLRETWRKILRSCCQGHRVFHFFFFTCHQMHIFKFSHGYFS